MFHTVCRCRLKSDSLSKVAFKLSSLTTTGMFEAFTKLIKPDDMVHFGTSLNLGAVCNMSAPARVKLVI